MPCQAGQSQNKHRQQFWRIMPRAITAALLTLVLMLASPARVLAEAGAEPLAEGVCVAPQGWWSSANLQPPYEDPANGDAPQTDCNFQQWSWMAFVHWMQTNPRTGQPLFLSLPTPEDLATTNRVRSALPLPKGLTMSVRFAKPLPAAILAELRAAAGARGTNASSINQAAGGALIDPNGRALYYTTHMNRTYADFARQYMGSNYAKANPDLNFPVGSTVLKAAWRVVEPGEDTSTLFTTEANIEVLDVDAQGNLITASPRSYRKELMALTGVHVVGAVNDHPEFIWATFENTNNAPNLPDGMSASSDSAVSDQDWLFYKAGTAASASNQSNALYPPDPSSSHPDVKVAYQIDNETQKITPVTNVFRMFAHGGAESSPADPGTSRVADIDSANADFTATIATGNNSIKPVFSNYRLIGSVWINTAVTPLEPGLDLVASSVGSINLANSVLETFFQAPGQNCFTCHNTNPFNGDPDKNIAISHIISGSLPPSPSGIR